MLKNDIQEVLINEVAIEEKCKELGQLLTDYYHDHPPILVALLKGSVPFVASLMKYIDLPIEIDFMDVSSYEGTESSGEINIRKDLDRSIKNREILLVEDIIDTGRTLDSVKTYLFNKGASDVKIVSLLDKPSRRVIDISADWVGFQVPDYFVVGFGLDFNQKYRNLGFIGILKEDLYK
jgi:hypoxanthine phosphoribosyltransferase